MHRKCISVQDFIIKHKKLTTLWSTFRYFKKGISEFCNSQKNMSVNETKSDSPLLILFLHTVKPDFAIYQKGRKNIFCHYKISNLLLLVFIFSPEQCYNNSAHLWGCHHIMGKTVRRACYIWLNIIWKLLRPAPESITLQSFTEDFFHLSKCSSHSLYWNYYETCKIVASPLNE